MHHEDWQNNQVPQELHQNQQFNKADDLTLHINQWRLTQITGVIACLTFYSQDYFFCWLKEICVFKCPVFRIHIGKKDTKCRFIVNISISLRKRVIINTPCQRRHSVCNCPFCSILKRRLDLCADQVCSLACLKKSSDSTVSTKLTNLTVFS